MKLLLAAVFCIAVFVAVDGKSFNFNCISLNVTGTVTVTAKNTKTAVTNKTDIDLSTVKGSITGDCSKPNSVKMTVAFDNTTNWELVFTDDKKMVTLSQSVTFDPANLFKITSMNESVTVPTAKPLALSADNASYLCESEQVIPFASKEQGDYSFTVSQDITFIQVQAFGLSKGTFSPADHCAADQPTTSPPTTPATPPPVPSGKPVKAEMFVVKDSKGAPCFRLKAGLQFAVEYKTTDNKTMAFSKVMVIPGSANVTGTCATGTANTATMTITNANYSLTITETRTNKMSQSAVKLTVTLDPADFPKAADAGKTVSFNITSSFQQSSTDTFYVCDTLQELRFENTNSTLYVNDMQLQAFNLNNGSFSGKGVRCSLDPTPSPMPPANVPGDNTYAVQDGNITCIVLKGEISFSNVTYATKTGRAESNPISIPAFNETTKNVNFSGSCDLEKGNAQQLTITFNKNWNLTLTFARGSTKDSSMLGATADEFRVRDVEFVYYLTPEFFPNASDPNTQVVARQMNITGDFMKGSVNGGSYKCDAKQTETLDTGVLFQTASLQYKAFNNNNSTSFGDNVSECSADDESNSIVPIAVGAALAGLVAIVLIAYLIGRRRSRRQGYESV